MPEPGDAALLLTDALALSRSGGEPEAEALLHDGDVARGPSSVNPGEEVILLNDSLAQGNGAGVVLGELKGRAGRYVGDSVTLQIKATNKATAATDYTVSWDENGTEFKNRTRTIGSGKTVTYEAQRTKSSPGCFEYQANDSNILNVCWLNVRPGELTAYPKTVYLGSTDTSSLLSVRVEVPDSESTGYDVTVDFRENLNVIGSGTASISPGSSHTFSTPVDSSEAVVRTFDAELTVEDTGRSATLQPVDVEWTNDPYAAVSLGPLEASKTTLSKGNDTTLSIAATNTADTAVSYDLGFFEGPTIQGDAEKTIGQNETVEYSLTLSRDEAGEYTFYAEDSKGVNRSNDLGVTWMNVDPGELSASPTVLYLSEENTTTLSISVGNPSSSSKDIEVFLREDGSAIDSDLQTIGSGSAKTFSFDVTKTEASEYDYQARILERGSDLSGLSNTVTVPWVEENEEFGDFIFSGRAESEQGGTIQSGSWTANNGSTRRIRIDSKTGSSTKIVLNDDPTLPGDWNDASSTFDFGRWESDGIIRVDFTDFASSGGGSEWTIEGYTIFISNGGADTVYMLADGTVVDGAGNDIGSWK